MVYQKNVSNLLITSNMDSYDSNQSFSDACAVAYNNHNELILTPDSIWLAIQTQFSVYLEKYAAEELRNKFVNHEGKIGD